MGSLSSNLVNEPRLPEIKNQTDQVDIEGISSAHDPLVKKSTVDTDFIRWVCE